MPAPSLAPASTRPASPRRVVVARACAALARLAPGAVRAETRRLAASRARVSLRRYLGSRLSLDQALLPMMVGDVRWARREGHVGAGARPNVLTPICPGPLRAVKPAAVGSGG